MFFNLLRVVSSYGLHFYEVYTGAHINSLSLIQRLIKAVFLSLRLIIPLFRLVLASETNLNIILHPISVLCYFSSLLSLHKFILTLRYVYSN